MPRKKKNAKPKKLTPAQVDKLGELVATGETFSRAMLSLQDVAADTLKIFLPRPELAYGVEPGGKYNAEMHAKVCRLKFLGLSDASTARALRLNPSTLSEWRIKYPQLACDMESAKELANARAAGVLQVLMDGDGPTAFNAVRYYLNSHSPEFREPTSVPPATDINVTIQQIRQQIYGLPPQRGSTPFGTPGGSLTGENINLIEPESITMDDGELSPAAAAMDDL